jgi:uncharacterized DUF497 family protein
VRFTYDPKKGQKLKRERGRDFEEIQEIFLGPHYFDHRNDDPEQWRAIGWSMGQLYTVIYEDREDEQQGGCRHLITLWRATTEEEKLYDESQ